MSWGLRASESGRKSRPLLKLEMVDRVLTQTYGKGITPTFTRASIASGYDKTGLLTAFASGASRLNEYDPTSLLSRGAELESVRTNLLTGSVDLTTGWSANGTTGATNQAISPDGTNNATLLTANTTASNTGLRSYTIGTLTTNSIYTASVYVKNPTTGVRIQPNGAVEGVTSGVSVLFNAVTKSVTSTAYGRGLVVATGVVSLPNDWYRIYITFQMTAATNVTFQESLWLYPYAVSGEAGSPSSLFYGAQFEAGGLSSYIPTAASTVNRPGEVWTFPITAPLSGTLVVWLRPLPGSYVTARTLAANWTDGGNSRLAMRLANSSGSLAYPGAAIGNGSAVVDIAPTTTVIVPNQLERLALTWDANGSQMCRNGVLSNIGGGYNGGAGSVLTIGPGDAYIERVEVYGVKVPASRLQLLAPAVSTTSPMLALRTINGQFQNLLMAPSTFSRASTATEITSGGGVASRANNEMRVNSYEPTTLLPKGALFESQKTNLAFYSDQFDNAYWDKANGGGATVAANAGVAPDGTTTADEITFSGQFGNVNKAALVTTTGTVATVSCWIKLISGNASLTLRGSTSATTYSTAITVDGTWKRYSASYTHDGTNAIGFSIQDRNASGFGKIQIWGAQVEVGGLGTYIPTTTAAATRQSDTFSIPTANWFNQTEGVFIIECGAATGSAQAVSNVRDVLNMGTSNNQLIVRAQQAVGSSTWPAGYIGTGSSIPGANAGTNVFGSTERMALSYSSTDLSKCAFYRNNGGVITRTAIAGLYSGAAQTSVTIGGLLDGYISKLDYYPAVPSDSDVTKMLLSPIVQYDVTTNQFTRKVGLTPTFSRASSAAFGDQWGGVSQLGSDLIRPLNLDYSSQTFWGALLESQKTNDATYSSAVTGKNNANAILTATPGIIDPAGGATTFAISASVTSSVNHQMGESNTISVTSGSQYTFSRYFKAGELRYVAVNSNQAAMGSNDYAIFDLIGGTVTEQASNVTARIVALPNGWYRCIATMTAVSTTTCRSFWSLAINPTNGARAPIYAGNLTDKLYTFGGQQEAGGLSSYIPTTTASVIRQADTMTLPITAPLAGTLVAWVRPAPGTITTARRYIAHWLDSGNNRLSLRLASGTGASSYPWAAIGNGTSQSDLTASTAVITPGTLEKVAFTWDGTSSQMCRNGTVSSVGVGYIGGAGSLLTVGQSADMFIERLELYDSRVTAATLQILAPA